MALQQYIRINMVMNDPNNKELVLYTRVGCHLCDQVADLLRAMEIGWTAVQIDTDPDLEGKYDIRIPVLYLPDTGKELFFPFNKGRILEFMQGDA